MASEACVQVRCGSFVGVGTARPVGAAGSTRSILIDAEVPLGSLTLRVVESIGSPLLEPARYAYVSSVYVRPESRRRGVLRALLAEAERWCRARGLSTDMLNVPAQLLPWVRANTVAYVGLWWIFVLHLICLLPAPAGLAVIAVRFIAHPVRLQRDGVARSRAAREGRLRRRL